MSSLQSTMLVLFGVIIIGYVAGKIGIINENANMTFSTLMLYITSPLLIISSISTSESGTIPVNIFLVMAIGVITYIFLIVFARIYVKIMPLNKFELPVHEVVMVFGNVAFLGYPVFQSLLGDSAIFVSTIMNLPFNILLFSYGMYLFTKDMTTDGAKGLKSLINPGFLAAIIALVIYLTGIKVPYVLNEIFTSIGNITIPLSMLMIGSSLATIDIKYLFKDYKVLVYSVIKLVVLPVLAFIITRLIGLDTYLIKMITLNVGFPAASMVVMLATQYKKSIRSASIAVFMSTLLSVITIPLIEKYLFSLL
ncbi:AEC family transporter [Miniphocaeibacter halophilus]|uniref:AEC family transporter n=1 Tax=Miniphocaeibacter halophilus TaxID=2931922 RepID=A0AC61MTK0_9FIRM|nr:AEC family transporter [Miniphocaeibacter halophilus]QQK08867.1 AEC family transporter [Miniphocaeibacter halophilus]